MKVQRRGALGVYPGDPCYDPGRAWWLPYWVDNVSENACKWAGYWRGANTGTMPPPPAPRLPAPDDPRGAGWTPGDVAAGMHDNYIDDVNAVIDGAVGDGVVYQPNNEARAALAALLGISAVGGVLWFAWPLLAPVLVGKGRRRR